MASNPAPTAPDERAEQNRVINGEQSSKVRRGNQEANDDRED
jgi:hypothetical protein